jgi:1-deoxy-D-xylulose-5-phosphate synthase
LTKIRASYLCHASSIRIDSPDNVKQLSLAELEQLAAEIREELIAVLSNNGGHLGPNLGVVELSHRLHYVF